MEHEEELIQREFNQMELGKFVQLLLKVQRTLLTNSSILLEEDSPMAKQNQQVQPERIMVWETIIILLDFGSKQLDKEGSPDSGLPQFIISLEHYHEFELLQCYHCLSVQLQFLDSNIPEPKRDDRLRHHLLLDTNWLAIP